MMDTLLEILMKVVGVRVGVVLVLLVGEGYAAFLISFN
jgi:hypothetical protein